MASRGPAQPDRHHVVALEEQYCGTPDLDLGEPYTLTSYATTANDEVANRIKPATILLTNTVTLNAYHLSSQYSPKLRMIAVQASGTDAIDLAACRKRGIVVCNASKANVPAVSEHAIGLYFAARRQFALTERALRADEWRRNGHCMHVMKDGNGKMPLTCRDEIMGLIGYGVIGAFCLSLTAEHSALIGGRSAYWRACLCAGDERHGVRSQRSDYFPDRSTCI